MSDTLNLHDSDGFHHRPTGPEHRRRGEPPGRGALSVEQKGYDRQDIEVEVPIEMKIAGEIYRSAVDLV